MKPSERKLKELNVDDVKLDVVALLSGVQTPAISKLQKKRVGDVSLNKLKTFVVAVGGSMAITITLPDGKVITEQ